MPSVVRLDVTKFIKVAAGHKNHDGSDARWTRAARPGESPAHAGLAVAVNRVARDIGCEPSSVSRILRGQSSCSGRFIANLLAAIGPVYRFDDVFTVDDESTSPVSAA